MSKRKSLARLAIEKSQAKEFIPDNRILIINSPKSSSNRRPLGHSTNEDEITLEAQVPQQTSFVRNGQHGVPVPPVIRRIGGAVRGHAHTTSRSNRHSYPAAAAAPQVGPHSPAVDCRQHPGRRPGSPPPSGADSPQHDSCCVSIGGPLDGGAASPGRSPTELGPPASTATTSGTPSAVSGGESGLPSLLSARPLSHAHSTTDLQQQPDDRPESGSPAAGWNCPMSVGHRTRSFPAGLASSTETLSSCSELSVGSALSNITVQKARSRGYLVNTTGSALLLGSEELNSCLPQRQLNILVGTWNMNAKEPPSCLDDLVLPDALALVPDMVVLGTQESHADHRGKLVLLQSTLGPSHVLFHSASLGTLHLCIFIRRDLIWYCSVPEEANFSIRQPTAIKTKGCVAVGFQFFGTTFLLLTCHLTAHLEKQNQRIDDVRRICAALDLPQAIPSRSESRDVTERYDHVFWFGDLNFRLSQSRPRVIDTIVDSSTAILLRQQQMSPARMQDLLEWDQLNHAKQKGRAFEGFGEGDISFLPTYKYDPGTNDFDTSSKQRIPAYTDRILFKSRRDGVRCVKYDSVHPFNTSDHKPVWGLYQCAVRPSMDNIPLAAGKFDRSVFLEGLRRRARHPPASRGADGRSCNLQ